MNFIKTYIAYIMALIFFVLGMITALVLKDMFSLWGSILLDIFILSYDYYRRDIKTIVQQAIKELKNDEKEIE